MMDVVSESALPFSDFAASRQPKTPQSRGILVNEGALHSLGSAFATGGDRGSQTRARGEGGLMAWVRT